MLAHVASAQAPQKPAPQEPQRPTFRAAANFVSVDAIPTGKDGRIIKGLTADDFDIREDGKPQKVESIEFVEFETWPVDATRRDPSTQREAFDLAADPRYRVYVMYLSRIGWETFHYVRQPILDMLQEMLGPRDLFGLFLSGRGQSAKDLTLGQRTEMVFDQIQRHGAPLNTLSEDYTPEEYELLRCFGQSGGVQLIGLRRLDQKYLDLEGLITVLGGIRQERKNIIYVGEGLSGPKPARMGSGSGSVPRPPQIGVTGMGTLTTGARNPGEADRRICDYAMSRLASIDFELRFRDLLQQARRANVAFYAVDPGGLLAPMHNAAMRRGGGSAESVFASLDAINARTDSLRTMADNTDGLAVVSTNDLKGGFERIANDLSSYYLLGYYSASGNWHGQYHRIDVRLKSTGDKIRSRREYRAPTLAELTPREGLSPTEAAELAVIDEALGQLAPLRNLNRLRVHALHHPGKVLLVAELPSGLVATTWAKGGRVEVALTDSAGGAVGTGTATIAAGMRGALVEVVLPAGAVGPWKASLKIVGEGRSLEDRLDVPIGTGTLLGDAVIFRATPAPASPLRPVADQLFRRTERAHIEWPVLAPLDRKAARVLDRFGKALGVVAIVSEPTDGLAVDVNLAPLTDGDYVIELVAGSGTTVDRKLVAIRVMR